MASSSNSVSLLRLPICSSCQHALRRTSARTWLRSYPKSARSKHTASKGYIAQPGEQAIPLSGLYAEILKSPTSKLYANVTRRPLHPTTPAAPPPKKEPDDPFLPSPTPTDKDDIRARASIVFGSRLAGPTQRRAEKDRASMNVAGILVPPKPLEPDNCCMSGCVNCVWDVYREDLEEWAVKAAEARGRLLVEGKGKTADAKRLEGFREGRAGSGKGIHAGPKSVDDDGGGSETNWGTGLDVPDNKDLFNNIPVGIREFMRTEKMLKERHAQEARPQ